MTTIDTEALRALADAGYGEIVRLCRPTEHWRMSVPADPTRDSDLILADVCRAVPALLDALAEREGEVARLRERERTLIRVKDADLDDLRHEVEARDVLVADVAKIAADAERWKADALPVMAGLQDLGRILGLRLGTRITGEASADAARALVTRADAAEAKVRAVEGALREFIRAWEDEDPQAWSVHATGVSAAEAAKYAILHDLAVILASAALATPEPTVQAWPQEDS